MINAIQTIRIPYLLYDWIMKLVDDVLLNNWTIGIGRPNRDLDWCVTFQKTLSFWTTESMVLPFSLVYLKWPPKIQPLEKYIYRWSNLSNTVGDSYLIRKRYWLQKVTLLRGKLSMLFEQSARLNPEVCGSCSLDQLHQTLWGFSKRIVRAIVARSSRRTLNVHPLFCANWVIPIKY